MKIGDGIVWSAVECTNNVSGPEDCHQISSGVDSHNITWFVFLFFLAFLLILVLFYFVANQVFQMRMA